MDWPRFWLTLALVALCGVLGALLYLGWSRRGRRQSGYPELPAVPDVLGTELAPPLTGIYVSTTVSGHWQDRIVTQTVGRRAKATVELHEDGILIDRIGETALWIPRTAVAAVGTAPGVAGKVMGLADGILLITWAWGDTEVDSGIRADDPDAQVDWITATAALFRTTPGATA
ncbi:MAG: transporter [Nakamurella sp.]